MEDRLTDINIYSKEAPEAQPAALALLVGWCLTTMLLFLFAFYRAEDGAPQWLLDAQAVCFGTTETGLPDTYGWFVLLLAPLSFLAALLVVYGAELRAAIKFTCSRTIGKVLLALLLVLGVIETGWVTGRITKGISLALASYEISGEEPFPENYPRSDRPAPPFELVDQHGRSITPESFKGQAVFLTFAFAHCQTICPAIVKNVTLAGEALKSDKTSILIVTLDPWRDTPSSLPSLAQKWELPANAHVLSGSVEQVTGALDVYGVARVRDDKSGDVTHPALVYVLSPEGRIAYTFNNPLRHWLVEAAARLVPDVLIAGANDP